MLAVLAAVTTVAFAGGRGIVIHPDAAGQFRYVDDFRTPKFFDDAFLSDLPRDSWDRPENSIVNADPNRNPMLTYRFYSDRVIATIDVRVDQAANNSPLGGRNCLYLSPDGLDWTLVASSEKQKAGEDGWQRQSLTVPSEQAAKFVGRSEVWVRVVLDNTSSRETTTSNRINSLEVKLKVGTERGPQAVRRAAWGELRRRAGWKSITLDRTDPIDQRAPHYYEDADGWLQAAGDNPCLAPDETEGFPVHRVCKTGRFPGLRALPSTARWPLSLAMFVKTKAVSDPLMVRITVRSGADSSRKMGVLWDGKSLATFNAAGYFDSKVFFVEIPGPQGAGVHELRIAGGDPRPILVRQITVLGDGSPRWVDKPGLPDGGSLEVLSAYYMPDPRPPAGSQTVEGRHKARPVGLIFRSLQRLYKEHADFGGLRVVVRNNAKVPVRIGNTLLLNGKPIEESYIDFGKSDWDRLGAVKNDWDARGVVWYRVRPRLLRPGQCGQVYIRFRRKPLGEHATVTIHLENGKPVEARVPYEDPGLVIDYVTTGKSMDTLYVYARRSEDADPGKVTAMRLNGEVLDDAKTYGRGFPGSVALVVAKLSEPLKLGDYHVVGIKTDAAKAVDAQFRVLPFFFPRSSFHASGKVCKRHHMNFAMHGDSSLSTAEKYDLKTLVGRNGMFNVHPRTAYIYGPDEPDAHDWSGCRKGPPAGQRDAMGLGYHARMLSQAGWHELIEHHARPVASWIIINGTSRPLNWAVYGQVADITSTDPYPNLGPR